MITLKGIYQRVKCYSLLKTIYFNFKCFPLSVAFNFPVYIGRNVKFQKLDGSCEIHSDIRHGMIRIASNEGIHMYDKTIIRIIEGGKIVFGGKMRIRMGGYIYVKGRLEIGDDIDMSYGITIIAYDKVTIGDRSQLGWEVQIMDTDCHLMESTETGERFPMTSPIIIGNHCWICNGSRIMKGSVIPNDVIVGSDSLVNKRLDVPSYSVVAGIPAKLKKEHITFDRGYSI